MRIDSHHHLWSYNARDYPWMTESMDVLRKDYLPDHFAPLLDGIGFEGSVVVQARQKPIETEWLLDMAGRHEFIRGVVGWVDFESDLLPQHLERLSSNRKLKGVRELIHDMPDLSYATSEVHMRGISHLARYGLTYDLLLKPPHIIPALDLVSRFPDQRFVVDHIAKPYIARQMYSDWRADIVTLAACDNVWCKVSGMVTEANWRAWAPEDFLPYIEVVVDAFGPARLMIGSDWPVCILSGDYDDVMQVVIDYTDSLSPAEQRDMLGETCCRFYNLAA